MCKSYNIASCVIRWAFSLSRGGQVLRVKLFVKMDISDLPNSLAGSLRPSWLAHCRLSTFKVSNSCPIVAFQLSKYRMAVPLSPFNFQSTEWLAHCRLSTFKVLNGCPIVVFQLQNFPIWIYCPVSASKLPYFDLLSSFNFKTSLFGFIVFKSKVQTSIRNLLKTKSSLPLTLASILRMIYRGKKSTCRML